MKRRTGSGSAGGVDGAQTLSERQSSEPVTFPSSSSWGQTGPNSTADLTPLHAAVGAGGRKRSAPVGGAANGRPRQAVLAPLATPDTAPVSVITAPVGAVTSTVTGSAPAQPSDGSQRHVVVVAGTSATLPPGASGTSPGTSLPGPRPGAARLSVTESPAVTRAGNAERIAVVTGQEAAGRKAGERTTGSPVPLSTTLA